MMVYGIFSVFEIAYIRTVALAGAGVQCVSGSAAQQPDASVRADGVVTTMIIETIVVIDLALVNV